MRYHYRVGVKQKGSRGKILWTVIPVVALLAGGYVLVNTFSPAIDVMAPPADATAKKLQTLKPTLSENRLYVPKVNIDVAVVDIHGDETAALERGAINRSPDSGNPSEGGNYVLAAHRFQLGLLPSQTRKKSPFYHIDQLQPGDPIYIDYEGTRYAYEVTERKMVGPDAIEIEKRTDEARLTMYSCELAGPKAGREVVIAKPVGTIAWDSNGKPKLDATSSSL